MRDRSGALPTVPTPAPRTAPLPPAAQAALQRATAALGWDDDDNKPWLPKVPGPRKSPQAVGA